MSWPLRCRPAITQFSSFPFRRPALTFMASKSTKRFKGSDSEPSSTQSTTSNSLLSSPSSSSQKAGSSGGAFDAETFFANIKNSRSNWGAPALFPFREERVLRIVNSSGVAQKRLPDAKKGECVLYWMSRDSRVQDNWAFIYAQRVALEAKVPLNVCYCLVPKFADATLRAYKFLLGGLQEVRKECDELDVPFYLLLGHAKDILPDFVKSHKVGTLVCDFSPLRVPMGWQNAVKDLIGDVPMYRVDAHNVVPCWKASDKEEIGARTIRSKIHKLLDYYHTAFPPVIKHPFRAAELAPEIDWVAAEASLEVNREVEAVGWAKPGTSNGLMTLYEFLTKRLKNYSKRNDPNVNALSNLSPWFKFGQISVARAVLEGKEYIKRFPSLKEGFDSFFEEAVVRRELADNFCFYQKDYDNLNGAKPWARETLQVHMKDRRPVLYTLKQLEEGRTADDLWNASQMQMVHEGKLHGFLRMYWAKKILEWTETPEQALQYCILLNDKYNMDGRDPNGYVGCMWSVCGIHDQGWKEREVFGKIRYMNYQGCQRKFDVAGFVAKYRKYIPKAAAPVVNYTKKTK